ncbi:MAG: cysteine hydrolase [Armatimonadetes bacterium]|nr:cysteine hydrolase [Armatimonadota bacterium]
MRPRCPFGNLTLPVPTTVLTRELAALLVLDVHHFSVSPDAGYGRLAKERGIFSELAEYYEQVDQALPNVRRLVATSRAHGLRVYFTRLTAAAAGEVSPNARVTGFWARADAREAAFLADPAPMAGEMTIDKTTNNAFLGTRLHESLQTAGVRNLVVCGTLANTGVQQTAREAADRGYGVVVATDAIAAETWSHLAFVSSTLTSGTIRVRPVAQIVEMMEGSRT